MDLDDQEELFDATILARVAKLPEWTKDLIHQLDEGRRTALAERDTAERLLREHTSKQVVGETPAAIAATRFHYHLGDQTYMIPADADVAVHIGDGPVLDLVVTDGRLRVESASSTVYVRPLDRNTVSIGVQR
jgi:methylmalonyl-CoA mutase N-terminal domain/subunit